MKTLLVHPGPPFSVADLYNGWAKALSRLTPVIEYRTDERLAFYREALLPVYGMPGTPPGQMALRRAMTTEEGGAAAMHGVYEALYAAQPDIVVFIGTSYLEPELLEVIQGRHKVVLMHWESPYEEDRQLTLAPYADLNLVNDPCNLEAYRKLGHAEYMPNAYDPAVHYPGGRLTKSDLVFVGTALDSRQEFFTAMDFGKFDVRLGGSRWGVVKPGCESLQKYVGHHPDMSLENSEAANWYRDARCGFNLYRQETEATHIGEGVAVGPREIEMAACEIPFLRDSREESDKIFPFLPSFRTPDEASEQLRWILSDEGRRRELGTKAGEAVQGMTFEANARSLLRLLDKD